MGRGDSKMGPSIRGGDFGASGLLSNLDTEKEVGGDRFSLCTLGDDRCLSGPMKQV